jgi:phosphatidylglycerophosphatase A
MGIVISRPSRATVGSAEPRFVPGVGVYHPGNGNSSTDLPPIPLEWIIAPLNATVAQCPSHAATLRTFGVTNVVVAVLAIVMGCRPILHKLTRGIPGTRGGNTVKWMWIVSLSLQLLANVFVSLLIKHTPGYGHLSILNIFALYSARPRASLIVLGLLRILMGVNLGKLRKSEKHPDEIEFIYADSYMITALAELCMQIFAAIFIGVTWNRFLNKPVKDYMKDSYKMMEALPGITFFGIGAVVPFYHRNGEAIPREYSNSRGQLVRSY